MKENMSLFLECAKENWEEAKHQFFSDSFKKCTLQGEHTLQEQYECLLIGQDRDQILEEFLICAGAKEPVFFSLEETTFTMPRCGGTGSIGIRQENWGYGTFEVKAPEYIKVSDTEFNTVQWEEGTGTIDIEVLQVPEDVESAVLEISSIYQDLKVTIYFEEEWEEEDSWKQIQKKYLELRCGRMKVEEYCQTAYELIQEEFGTMASLFCFHLAILSGSKEEAENRMEQMKEERPWEDGQLEAAYYDYLHALYKKTNGAIAKAVENIKNIYNNDCENKNFLLWMLLYLDEELAYSEAEQWKAIEALEEPLEPYMIYEAAACWNRDPIVCTEESPFMLYVLQFALQQNMVSKEVWGQFSRIMRRKEHFSKQALALMEELYAQDPKDEYLENLCRSLILSGKWQSSYHEYYKKAIDASIKIDGLYEAYIRSMEEDCYEIMNPAVLHYFSYSSSLSMAEKAYLYANVIQNKEEYVTAYAYYEQNMEGFVIDLMESGILTNAAILLYKEYTEQIVKREDGKNVLLHMLCKHKICCNNRHMKQVLVFHPQKEHPDLYTLHHGKAYCDLYSPQAYLCFLDDRDRIYIASVDYEVEPVLVSEEAMKECRKKHPYHEIFVLMDAGDMISLESIEETDIPMAEKIMAHQSVSHGGREMILELLLEYYHQTGNKKKQAEYLDCVQWDEVQEKNKTKVIEYFIEEQRYEEALVGMERYGYEEVRKEYLEAEVSYLFGQLQGRKSLFTASLCEALFLKGSKDEKVLSYLQKYIPAEAAYGKELWMAGWQQGIYDNRFTEKLLWEQMEEQKAETELLPAFYEYRKRNPEARMTKGMWEYYCQQYCMGNAELEHAFFQHLTQYFETADPIYDCQRAAWLIHYGKQQQLTEKEIDMAKTCMEVLMEKQIYLPVYLAFEAWMEIPKELYSMAMFSYCGEPGAHVVFHGVIGEEDLFEQTMIEVYDGYYTGYGILFADEQPDVWVTVGDLDEPVTDGVRVERPVQKGNSLRYQRLNQMLEETDAAKVRQQMVRYSYIDYMITKAMQPWLEEE